MSKALQYDAFNGTDQLEWRETVDLPLAADEARVNVKAVSLNPMDWLLPENETVARTDFGLSLPGTFGYDFAGEISEVGANVTDFKLGDRVFGGNVKGSTREQMVINAVNSREMFHTPDEISDELASTLAVAGMSAAAALHAVNLGAGDRLLIGGASGGVGTFAVQLARLRGAEVIGTAAKGTFDYLEMLGARPVEYGAGLAERLQEVAPNGINKAIDLFGREVVELAQGLGLGQGQISTIVPYPSVPDDVILTGGIEGTKADMNEILTAIVAGKFQVPIAAQFDITDYQAAIALQRGRHVHGKVVLRLV